MKEISTDVPGKPRILSRLNLGVMIVALLAPATLLFMTGASVSASHVLPSAKVKPDKTFANGQTITIQAPGNAGATYDLLARIVAPVLAADLHCTVVVQDNNNSISSQDISMTAPGNGLTIGMLNPTADVEQFVEKTGAFTFSMRKVNVLAGVSGSNSTIDASISSPYKTIKQVLKGGSGIKFMDTNAGFTDEENRVLLGAYGVPTSSLLSGFASPGALLNGFVAGDAPLANIVLSVGLPIIVAHQARPLLTFYPLKPGNNGYAEIHPLKIPTLAQEVTALPPPNKTAKAAIAELERVVGGVGMIFATSPSTPASINLELETVLQQALTSKANLAQMNSANIGTTFYSAANATKGLFKEITQANAMAPYLPVSP